MLGSRPARAAVIADEIPAGSRNSTLASLAGTMRRRGMGQAEILAALEATNRGRCTPPLEHTEVEHIAASISRYQAAETPATSQEPTGPPFEVLTARELCLLADPPTSDYLLGPVLVRGMRTVLGAHTGEGKTTLALEMMAAVVQSREWLEWTGAGGTALVIDAEQGLRTIKRRLREIGLDKADNIDYLRVPDGLALDQDGSDAVQLDALLTSGNYSLVVADPLYKLHRGDSNEERHAVDLMRRLDRWRDQHGFALLMLVHLPHPRAPNSACTSSSAQARTYAEPRSRSGSGV
jgi:predicted ATP-dependent serine protease